MNAAKHNGFTLIELIVTMVLVAISLAAILPLLDRVYLMSYEPGAQMRQNFALRSAMEELILWHTNGLESLRLHVGSEGSIYAGQFDVRNNRYISMSGFVESPPGATNNLLKVTLENDLGETVTRLFTVPL